MPNRSGGLNIEEIILEMAKDVTELVCQNKMMLHIQQQHTKELADQNIRISRVEKWKFKATAISAGFSAAGGVIGGFLGYMKVNWVDFFSNGGSGL